MPSSRRSKRNVQRLLAMTIRKRKPTTLVLAVIVIFLLWKTESQFLRLANHRLEEDRESNRVRVPPVRRKEAVSTMVSSAQQEDSLVKYAMTDFQTEGEEGFVDLLKVDRETPSVQEVRMPLYHDVYTHEEWPDLEVSDSASLRSLPRSVHYLWCGRKQFLFRHYLALLSAVRMLSPSTIFFHYSHLPEVDLTLYNVWFQEMKNSLPHLQLVRSNLTDSCGTKQLLTSALKVLVGNGGFIMGEDVVLAGYPKALKSEPFWFAFSEMTSDLSRGMIAAPRALRSSEAKRLRQELEAGQQTNQPGCVTVNRHNASLDGFHHCIVLSGNIYPRDLWSDNSSFAELARWVYYGQRASLTPIPHTGSPIPRVAHVIWLTLNLSDGPQLGFQHFLSILSALHVGGLKQVYVHGNVQPRGEWWRALEGENVTFVKIDRPQTMFQQDMSNLQAGSDFLRANILTQFGGVYMDRDVLWTSRIPDWLFDYPAVASFDWPTWGMWPDCFNLGVLMARAQAPWLRHWQDALRFYQKEWSSFTATYMPYKILEHHPRELLVYDRLQVICFRDICHPTWEQDFRRVIQDKRPTLPFQWRDVHAIHVTQPKPPTSWATPQAVFTGQDVFAEIGRYVLEKSGRSNLQQTGKVKTKW